MYTNRNRSLSVRFVLSGLLVVIVGLGMLAITPSTADASGGTFGMTSVRCWPGRYDMTVDLRGTYVGQWGAMRHLLWSWTPDRGWVYMGATEWSVLKLDPPNSGTSGGHSQNQVASGIIISIATEVRYWNGTQWGAVQRHPALHYQGVSPLALSSCRT